MNNEINNWLDAEVFSCFKCGMGLFKIWHSPFADEDVFYCSSCPKRVDVGFYDKKRGELSKNIDSGKDDFFKKLIKEIESNLTGCDCGGNYQYNSSRRCYRCSENVIKENSSFELYPSFFYYKEDREPTEEELEKVEKFKAEFIKTQNIWKIG